MPRPPEDVASGGAAGVVIAAPESASPPKDSTIDAGPICNVVIIFAMQAEAQPLIDRLQLQRDDPRVIPAPAPCETYSGTLPNGLAVHVVWNGRDPEHGVDLVGTVPASLAAYLALQAFAPDLVISAGTAGGFRAQGASIGDVFVSRAKMHHDRRIPLPGFEAFGLGYIPCTSTPNMQAALGFKSGVVSSGDSLDYTDRCMDLMVKHSVAVKEMEAGAIGWVVQLFHKPMFCIKAITDIVDGDRPTNEEFLENLQSAAGALQEALPRVLEFVAGKTVDQL